MVVEVPSGLTTDDIPWEVVLIGMFSVPLGSLLSESFGIESICIKDSDESSQFWENRSLDENRLASVAGGWQIDVLNDMKKSNIMRHVCCFIKSVNLETERG